MKEIYPTPKRLVKIIVILIVSILVIYKYKNYLDEKEIREKLTISLAHSKYLEYGSNVNSLELVSKTSFGKISDYPEEVDTSSVGIKKLTYEISEKNVSKKVSFLVEVKDTKKPVITFKNDIINVRAGDNYNFNNNILSVIDKVDGPLLLSNKLEKGTYIISSSINTNRIGSFKVIVRAMDKNENIEEKSYTVNVINKSNVFFKTNTVHLNIGNYYNINSNILKVVDSLNHTLYDKNNGRGYYKISSNYNKDKAGTYKVFIEVIDKYNNKKTFSYTIVVTEVRPVSTQSNSNIVNVAKNYLGYRYRYGGNSPTTGFDCSGYVHYVFSKSGIEVGRTIISQKNSGKRVSRNAMAPGDILIWSHRRDGYPTHSAIYIGNNKMIHAANARFNVEIRDLSTWIGRIVDIRRV